MTRKNLYRLPAWLGVLAVLFSSCEEPSFQSNPSASLNSNKTADVSVTAAAVSYSMNNWMGSVDGNKKISELSIPGTHDSGARFEPISSTAKCQNLTIGEQLNAGVRYLDIRCRHYNNAFTIHHGSIYQNLNFSDVKNACLSFLQSNPSETIIMHIKEEHTASGNNRTFEATLESYLAENPGLWYLGESIPALSSVRGKIVLVRRFAASNLPKGIDVTAWGDNTTFEINTSAANLKIQDQYVVPDNNGKWNVINALLSEAKTGSASRLYINYSSGYKSGIFGIPNINTVANNINPRLTTFFTNNTSGRYGIIAMDFADASKASLIVQTNF